MRVYSRLLCRSSSFDCSEWRNGINNSFNRSETVYTLQSTHNTKRTSRRYCGSAAITAVWQFGSVGQKTVVARRSVFLKTLTARKIIQYMCYGAIQVGTRRPTYHELRSNFMFWPRNNRYYAHEILSLDAYENSKHSCVITYHPISA